MSVIADPLPAWVYESKQGPVIGAVTLFSVLAIAAVILRFKCRLLVRAGLAIDDWLILAALPVALAEAICVAYTTKDTLGRHIQVVSAPALLEGGKMFFTIQILWIISSAIVKLSILAFYLRVFSILDYIRFSAWFLIVMVTCWLIGSTVAHGLQCQPVAKIWQDSLPGHCLDTESLFLIGSIADVVMDFLILALPLPAIIRLQMPLSRKLELVVIFALGGLTCVLSLVRFLEAKDSIYDRSDITWKSWFPLIWGVAEPCLGTLCACLPILQPLMQGLKEGVTKLSSSATTFIPNNNKNFNGAQHSWKPKLSHRDRGVEIPTSSEVNLQEVPSSRHWDSEASCVI
ncbi:hypothetical protein GL218_05829 [Daldinia childiae]|uniref:uncharacterized protein n=1 Tax=Daldinia childiae TaxID=326645 RepID=UPI001446CB18|nr:uncharacterized protein GL218_05829 [Daldinia childiae]KAF3058313.1 hypothetical protein GL218_05829 [Daldinia childiae]